MKTVYLDNNATTPCDPEIVAAMLPFLTEDFGNPDSPHVLGRRAAEGVSRAREQVADLLGCDPSRIVFTAGATESNNLVILGLRRSNLGRRGILASAVEHKAVLGPCEFLEENGTPVTRIPVNAGGTLELAALEDAIDDSVQLVSVQAANNETGVVQPVSEIASRARQAGALVHCDAAQALGKIPFPVLELGVDFASFSAHKLYGPKGVGALYTRNSDKANQLSPRSFGGGQEGGLRPGTPSVAAIVGFGEACRVAQERLHGEMRLIAALRDRLERDLVAALPSLRVNGAGVPRLPGTTNVTIPGVPADALLANVPDVCFSNGSACTSGTVSPSHVLLAMGVSREDAECAVRLSVGRQNTVADIEIAVQRITHAAQRLQMTIA